VTRILNRIQYSLVEGNVEAYFMQVDGALDVGFYHDKMESGRGRGENSI
jgi:hypothetical protein